MHKTLLALLALLASGGLVAGCGSSSSNTTTSSSSSSTTQAASSSPTTSAAPASTTGKAANPHATPIVVGFNNLESASASSIQIRIGLQQGLQYVNDDLGGVNGHPLRAIICKTDTTPASEIACANEFVSDHVVADFEGSEVAASSALPILEKAGIAAISFSGTDAPMDAAKGEVFNFNGSDNERYAAFLIAAKDLGKTNVLMPLPDVPIVIPKVKAVILPVAEKLGIKVKVTYYPFTESDWSTTAASWIASGADAIIPAITTNPQCTGYVSALKALNYNGTIMAGLCNQFTDATGVYVGSYGYTPQMQAIAPPSVSADIAIYNAWMAKQSTLTPANYSTAYAGFEEAVNGANMLAQTKGSFTAANVKESLPATHGPLFMNTNTYNCSGDDGWPNTSGCSTGVVISQFTNDTTQKLAPFNPVNTRPVWPTS
jgi:branched-chain amino acid transport system substrate-binding protein